jgi:hypothetical protein
MSPRLDQLTRKDEGGRSFLRFKCSHLVGVSGLAGADSDLAAAQDLGWLAKFGSFQSIPAWLWSSPMVSATGDESGGTRIRQGFS